MNVLSRVRRVVGVSLVALLATLAATSAGTGTAQAATGSSTAQHVTVASATRTDLAASCDPKLDYEYRWNGTDTWTNFCGVITFRWPCDTRFCPKLVALRLESATPYRVWLHQGPGYNGSACFWGTGKDFYMGNYTNADPWILTPYDIQVSPNTAYCAPPPSNP